MTTRRWMVAVAVVAVGCAAVTSLAERRERFARIARQYSVAAERWVLHVHVDALVTPDPHWERFLLRRKRI
jgi:hypothetical protein